MGVLDGKVAIITGGCSGIGKTTAKLFCEEGAKVVLADIWDERGCELEEEFCVDVDDSCVYIHTDVSNEKHIKASVDLAIKKYGRIDIVFSNAGIPGPGVGFEELELEDFNKVIAIHLTAFYLYVKHAVPHMKKQMSGCFLTTGSVAGFSATPGFGTIPYSAAKAGLMQMVRNVAFQYGMWKIRANVIAPGGIMTGIFGIGYGISKEAAEKYGKFMEPFLAQGQAIRRAGKPEDIAKTALFLASNRASFISGQTILVDGGLLAGQGPPVNVENYEARMMEFLATLDQTDRDIIIAGMQEGTKKNLEYISSLPEEYKERALKQMQKQGERRKGN